MWLSSCATEDGAVGTDGHSIWAHLPAIMCLADHWLLGTVVLSAAVLSASGPAGLGGGHLHLLELGAGWCTISPSSLSDHLLPGWNLG